MTIHWKSIGRLFSLVAFTSLILSGCLQSDYTKLVKEELGKGIRNDSVLLGIQLGDTRQEYYGKCFDLNKARLVTDGGGGFAQYVFKDTIAYSSAEPIQLRFHANFDNKNILAEMFMELTYLSAAPGIPRYQSDSLQALTKKLLMGWYKGNDFVTAKVDGVEVPVKVDGNRRILIYPKDTFTVQVKVQDILHPIFQHSITREEFSTSTETK